MLTVLFLENQCDFRTFELNFILKFSSFFELKKFKKIENKNKNRTSSVILNLSSEFTGRRPVNA